MATFYQTYLEKILAERKAKNSRYSLRALATALELHPSALSRMLGGKQELSVPAALKIIRKLKMSPEEQEQFIVSVAQEKYQHALSTLSQGAETKALSTALRESEERFRMLFDIVDQGVQLAELIRDPNGKVIDIVILRANKVWEKQVGIPLEKVIGKSVSEWYPTIGPDWYEPYDAIVKSGIPQRQEYYQQERDRWFEIFVIPTEGDRYLALVTDTTDRKKREEELQTSNRHKEFLIRLGDKLRTLSAPTQIQDIVARMLGEYLGVNRCFFAPVVNEKGEDYYVIQGEYLSIGAIRFPSRVRVSSFPSVAKRASQGENIVIHDIYHSFFTPEEVKTAESLGFRAALGIPVVENGRHVGFLNVHHFEPRLWTEDEIELLQEVALRTWANIERGRAELVTMRFRALADTIPDFIAMTDMDFTPVYVNPAGLRLVGLSDLKEVTSLMDFIDPEDKEKMRRELHGQITREHCREIQVRLRQFQGGKPLSVNCCLMLLRCQKGQPSVFAAVTRNASTSNRT